MSRAIISYDENGMPNGVLDIDYVQSRPTQIIAQAFHAEDWNDRTTVMDRISKQIAPDDDKLKIVALTAAVAEMLELIDSMVPVVELSGLDPRGKLREVYTLESER